MLNDQLRTPPEIEPSPEWLARLASSLAREIKPADRHTRGRPRPHVRPVAVAAVVALLATGAALATSRLNPIDWLRSSGSGEARFSIDATRTVSEPVTPTLSCGRPSHSEFKCHPGGSGRWLYDFYQRVEPQPSVTRENLLTTVTESERRGAITSAQAEEIRAQLAKVGDDFFLRMSFVLTLSSIASPHVVSEGVVLAPPEEVPQFITCRSGSDGFDCTTLSAAVAVPIGTPIYGLRESDDWVEKPYAASSWSLAAFETLFEDLSGRKLTPAEGRLITLLRTTGASQSGAGSGDTETATSSDDDQ